MQEELAKYKKAFEDLTRAVNETNPDKRKNMIADILIAIGAGAATTLAPSLN